MQLSDLCKKSLILVIKLNYNVFLGLRNNIATKIRENHKHPRHQRSIKIKFSTYISHQKQ